MKNFKSRVLSSCFIAASITATVSWAAPTPAHQTYACMATMRCENAANSLPQDLPGEDSALVSATSAQQAKDLCKKNFPHAFASIERTAKKTPSLNCHVQPEVSVQLPENESLNVAASSALRAKTSDAKKSDAPPASR